MFQSKKTELPFDRQLLDCCIDVLLCSNPKKLSSQLSFFSDMIAARALERGLSFIGLHVAPVWKHEDQDVSAALEMRNRWSPCHHRRCRHANISSMYEREGFDAVVGRLGWSEALARGQRSGRS